MADIDANNPQDSAIVSTYPANERASRAALVAIIGAEHSSTTGRHKVPRGTTVARDAVSDWEQGSLFINTDTSAVQYQDAAQAPFSWKDIHEFPSGTKMVFHQAAAPTGWTQDTTVNDRVLRVVSTAGGGSGGNWTLSGMAVDGHALTESEIPAHTHFMFANVSLDDSSVSITNTQQTARRNAPANNLDAYDMAGTSVAATLGLTGSTGGGQTHTHGLTNTSWRPSYIDVIVASKD